MARYDGKWVLRTNTELAAAEVALKYKQLWMVEEIFRSAKSLLETRPIFHKCDDTIRGHVFCSFLALVLRKELQARLEAAGSELEWAEVMADLEALEDVEVVPTKTLPLAYRDQRDMRSELSSFSHARFDSFLSARDILFLLFSLLKIFPPAPIVLR